MPHIDPKLWTPRGVESLEPAADTAVRSDRNALVIAGPGAGKTELLAQRACFLLETGRCRAPQRILAISFKRDAAKNLSERVTRRCGEMAKRFESLTLDAFGKSLVDRFLSALPNEWRPNAAYEVLVKQPRIPEIRDWFLSLPAPTGHAQPNFHGMSDSKLRLNYELCQFGCPLPFDDEQISPTLRHYSRLLWESTIRSAPGVPSLTFPMLNRLAAYLFRRNGKLLAALRATYSHVFMDEYQDTTASQYDLVQTAFQESSTILTAVGDSKQRIMVWAGAMEDAFQRFESDFRSEKIYLLRNYRSAPELVRIQHLIAEAIEKGTPPAEAVRTTGAELPCSIMEFASPEDEARHIGALIATGLNEHRLKPRDFCVLARQKTAQMIEQLRSELATRGIALRDESSLQDVLSEPFTQLVLALLRLATRRRDPEAWEFLVAELGQLHGVDDAASDDRPIKEAQRLLEWTKATVASQGLDIEVLPSLIAAEIGQTALQTAYRQYRTGTYLTELAKTLGTTLKSGGAAGLATAVNDLIGEHTIPAMTVHKSKGLEFHTVMFVGLEDSQLWNFEQQSEEEIRGFFVAFSRAIHRVIFTFSDTRDGRRGRERQGKNKIKDLYALLKAAGVPTIDMRPPSAPT